MDVRLPITMRSRGNWSVLYVRIVCVTTLPKCLVHMVSSLKTRQTRDKWFFFKCKKKKVLNYLEQNISIDVYILKIHIRTEIFLYTYTLTRCGEGDIYSSCSSHETYRQLAALGTIKPVLLFLIPSITYYLNWKDELVFLTRHSELIGQERIFYSITKTELFKLTFQRGKRVAGSWSPTKLPVNVIILMNCYRVNANID